MLQECQGLKYLLARSQPSSDVPPNCVVDLEQAFLEGNAQPEEPRKVKKYGGLSVLGLVARGGGGCRTTRG